MVGFTFLFDSSGLDKEGLCHESNGTERRHHSSWKIVASVDVEAGTSGRNKTDY